jgi:hypothetical protein
MRTITFELRLAILGHSVCQSLILVSHPGASARSGAGADCGTLHRGARSLESTSRGKGRLRFLNYGL